MLTPLLLAAALQLTPAPQEMPAQPARAGQTPKPAADPAMPGTQGSGEAKPATAGGTDSAAETAQPTPRPDPARLPVDAQFARYDVNGDGSLDLAEFGDWLVALRTAKEANFDREKPEARAWVQDSFTATDANRDQKISRAEWARFLTPVAG
ncbi:EF-hand domain-containing protein [uncultured Sphingomonas sp.]|uniref:EF-hand domain-containing protein n=1 Tax=uncultured Sphingomonas sp. TaxID=158754 RepID=UPI0025D58439|nr:EF-hand domain-containing protein [uncultured Sphingomonas sp.]